MQELGVPTTVHYPMTMPDQPWYQKNTPMPVDIKHSRWAASHVISLPMYPDMDATTQQKIVEAVRTSVEFSVKNS